MSPKMGDVAPTRSLWSGRRGRPHRSLLHG